MYTVYDTKASNYYQESNYSQITYWKCDEAHDYADYAENRLDTMKETVNQLRDMSGEFSTKKAKTELTKLIDSLLKQQAKLS